MSKPEWIRIPADITAESDRRTIVAIFGEYGLDVHIRKEKVGNRVKRFVECREQVNPEKSFT